MCGLIGVCGTEPVGDPADLLAKVAHRGPDSQGWAAGDGWWLGHTRLAIQDAAGDSSKQPYRQGPITLTYNGELWNADKIDVGPRDTRGDTEVVAKVLEKFGAAGLSLLDGMWAMAWHDSRSGLVRLARDPFGKVPLYGHTTSDIFGQTTTWASEYGALPHGAGAWSVAPGEVVTICDGLVAGTVRTGLARPQTLEPTPEAVLGAVRRGVAERLVGDRPIAFMLSGGLDSSLILQLALQSGLLQYKPVAYTAVMDETSQDLQAARWLAADLGVTLVEVPVPPVSLDRIREAVNVVEIPMKAQVEIALAHLPIVKAMARDGFAVCLSGEAADELFGGYGNMQIQASSTDDEGYRAIKQAAVSKMARGNFSRVNKVGMRYGVECRLPFMQTDLVHMAVNATKEESPPGKKLLKEAAALAGVPARIISRPKETFQGSVGTAGAAGRLLVGNPTTTYNRLAREAFGHLPRT